MIKLYRFVMLFFLFNSTSDNLIAEVIAFEPANTSAFNFSASSISDTEVLVDYRTNYYEATTVKIDGNEYSQIEMEGSSYTNERGLPRLPRISKNIMIPKGATWSIDNVRIDVDRRKALPVVSAKGSIYRNQNPETVSHVFNKEFYQTKIAAPKPFYSLSDRFVFRSVHGTTLSITPFQYDAEQGAIVVAKKISFTIRFDRAADRADFLTGPRSNSAFNKLYRSQFVGMNSNVIASLDNNVGEEGRLLIISHKNFLSGLGKFSDWKRQMGYQVDLVSLDLVGSTTDEIRDYIQKYYNYYGDLAFVLFVGDAEFIPYYRATAGPSQGEEADPMFGLLDGNDSYPEVIVARFPVKTLNDLDKMVSRSIAYEREPLQSDFYGRAIGIASDEGIPTDAERAEDLRSELMGSMYTEVDQFYDPGAKTSDISAALNEGRGLVNYIGHGDTTSWVSGNFSNSNIRKLRNTSRLPAIVSVACLNGNFGESPSDSFAEAWLKAGTVDKPTGAIAVFASSTNQAWVPPTVGQRAIVDMVAAEDYLTVGALFLNGSIAVLRDADADAIETFQTWHIFGDPTLHLRTREPTHMAVMPLDRSQSWSSLLRSFNVGKSGHVVTVMHKGQLLARGRSSANGDVNFYDISPNLPEAEVQLTISGNQIIPRELKLTLTKD